MVGNNLKTKIVEFNAAGKRRWTVTTGSAVVKIYFTPHGEQELFTVSRWLDGKRKRQVFSSLDAATAEATTISRQIAAGNAGNAALTSSERASFQRANQLLHPTGIPLELAVSEFVQAHKRLNGGASLAKAVEFYLSRHPAQLEPKMVKDVVSECLESKRQDGLSERYLQQLTYDLNRFADRFHNRIGDVSGLDIDAWLRSLDVTMKSRSGESKPRKPRPISAKTRNNLRAAVNVLFSFAKAKRYLPKDHDELDSVATVRNPGGEIGIFRPREMQEILSVAKPEHIPFLVLGAFAGIRHAEIQRLDWQDIKWKAGIIEIRAAKAKTASRRTIPILPNLKLWLADLAKESGTLCSYANMADELVDLKNRVNEARTTKGLTANFEWQHNGLRHSFISYRVAQTQNVAQTALEAGNSPAIIFRNYRELVTHQDAEDWFGIMPPKVGCQVACESTALEPVRQ